MRIVCPSCSASYDVADSLVPAGRIVRCARCGGQWAPVADAVEIGPPPQAEPDAPAEPEPPPTAEVPAPPPATEAPAPEAAATARQSAMDRLTANPPAPQSSTRLRLAWAGSFAVLVLALFAAYTWRTEIVTAWPPSARAYAAFGLHPQAGTTR